MNTTNACAARSIEHEHGWSVESCHRTSDGVVTYVRCVGCGTQRIDLQQRADVPPTALSIEVRRGTRVAGEDLESVAPAVSVT